MVIRWLKIQDYIEYRLFPPGAYYLLIGSRLICLSNHISININILGINIVYGNSEAPLLGGFLIYSPFLFPNLLKCFKLVRNRSGRRFQKEFQKNSKGNSKRRTSERKRHWRDLYTWSMCVRE